MRLEVADDAERRLTAKRDYILYVVSSQSGLNLFVGVHTGPNQAPWSSF